jgi:cysteine-rich repeat protein
MTRRIWRNTASFATPVVLKPGVFWLDWAATDTAAAGGHFHPSVTVVGSRGLAGWNARQLVVSTNAWAGAVDVGNPSSAPGVPQDFPFEINGTFSTTCGDGIVVAGVEACDDGNTVSSDGCDANCKKESMGSSSASSTSSASSSTGTGDPSSPLIYYCAPRIVTWSSLKIRLYSSVVLPSFAALAT